MLTASDLYRGSLPYPIKRVAVVDATDINGNLLAADIPVIGGSVSAELASTVTRSLDLTVDDTLFPTGPTDPLSPYVSVLRVRAGIEYPDGSQDLFPVFRGRVYQVDRGADGKVHIQADDLAADVISYRFESPQGSVPGGSTVSEIQRLISGGLPQATFGTNDVNDQAVPVLTWDEDRGRALNELAVALQARWYALGNGDFVVRRYPYTVPTPVGRITDGQPSYTTAADSLRGIPETTGVIAAATRSVTRDGTANSVTVVSERLDGSAPIRYTARDFTADSPTFFGGLYGSVSIILKPQTTLDLPAAQALARAQLNASRALTEQWSFTMAPDYSLEPGDALVVGYRGQESTQVIDRITYPLMTDKLMAVGTRSSIPEELPQ